MVTTKKTVLGLSEPVRISSSKEQLGKRFTARIDTGALLSSLDRKLVEQLNLVPFRKQKVRSANGITSRPVVKAWLEIANKKFVVSFTVADRERMIFPILIGCNALRTRDFIISPDKK